MVNLGSIEDQRETEIGKTIANPGGSTQCMPIDAPWGQGRTQAERVTDPRAMPLLETKVECFRVSRLRPDWAIQKEQSFGKLQGRSYLRDTKGESLGENVTHKDCWKVVGGAYICM